MEFIRYKDRPNPVLNAVTIISALHGQVGVTLTDPAGRIILTGQFTLNAKLDLSYFLQHVYCPLFNAGWDIHHQKNCKKLEF